MDMAVPMARVWDVLVSNMTARLLFDRLLDRGTPRYVAQNVVILLLWLEHAVGITRIVDKVSATRDHGTLRHIVLEAQAITDYVYYSVDVTAGGAGEPPEGQEGLPGISSMCRRTRLVDWRFFRFHRHLVARGLHGVANGVAAAIFSEGYQMLRLQYRTGLFGVEVPLDLCRSVVNAVADPADCRSVFFTFSPGLWVTRQEIFDYFTSTYLERDCIERITVETDVAEGETTKHGLIVFKSEELVEEVMDGKGTIDFNVKGVGMLLHMYKLLWTVPDETSSYLW